MRRDWGATILILCMWNLSFFIPFFHPHQGSSLTFLITFFDCTGSLLLCVNFLDLLGEGAAFRCGVQTSRCNGFSCCGAQTLGTWALVVGAHRRLVALQHVEFSQTRIEPVALALAGSSYPLHHQGSPVSP